MEVAVIRILRFASHNDNICYIKLNIGKNGS